jgi:hypothetical protein
MTSISNAQRCVVLAVVLFFVMTLSHGLAGITRVAGKHTHLQPYGCYTLPSSQDLHRSDHLAHLGASCTSFRCPFI